MDEVIRLSKSCIDELEHLAVKRVLDAEYLGFGEEVIAFEAELSDYLGREVVCVSSGTAALQLALEAQKFNINDEVMVPAITYVASYQAVSGARLKPIACEVKSDMSLDVSHAASLVTSRTKAIMPVHYGGDARNIDDVYKFAETYGLSVIEDAAHAFGSKSSGRRIGSFGGEVCFSFDGIKNITSGEGGCVSSDCSEKLNYIKDARLLGVVNDTEKRKHNQRSYDFDVVAQGWRYHMSNIMAAIGREQLRKIESFSNIRQKLAKTYDDLLVSNQHITRLDCNYDEVVPHIYPIWLKSQSLRDELKDYLNNKHIQTGLHYTPNHLLKFFKTNYDIPMAVYLSQTQLTLPLHCDLTKAHVEFIVETLNNFFE